MVPRLLLDERLDVAFQPIVDLPSGEVVGVEALGRALTDAGDIDPAFSPVRLLAEASQGGLLAKLEKRWRSAAFRRFRQSACAPRLFLNVDPRLLLGRFLTPDELVREAQAEGVDPEQVVLELVESHGALSSAELGPALVGFRESGFSIALDDLGSGYATLRTLVELKPDIAKLDGELVRNVDRDGVRHAVLRALVRCCSELRLSVVAEGIESEAERKTLAHMGVHWGQGYLLGRPALAERSARPPAVAI